MSKTAECVSQEIAWDFYTYAYSYDGSNLEYLGRAPIGSSKADAVWQIVKFTYSVANVTDKQWASMGSFKNVWNDRVGLSYS